MMLMRLYSVIRGSRTRITSDAYLSAPYGEFIRSVRLYGVRFMTEFNTDVYLTWKGHIATEPNSVKEFLYFK